jgi:ankyrin repeat protein
MIIGLTTFAAGGAYLMPHASAPWVSMSKADTDLFWREVSGPNGERAPVGLPLYQAVFEHDHEAVTRLLDDGASPNALLYPQRWSPLMVAIAYQDKDMVRLLLKHGANIDYVSNDPANYTPLGVALNAAIGDALRHGGNYPRIDFSMFNYLLVAGANVNIQFHDEDIAIFSATLGQMDIVNQLLARGYHRDLADLKRTLEIIQVSEDVQAEKDRAIRTIDHILKQSGVRGS